MQCVEYIRQFPSQIFPPYYASKSDYLNEFVEARLTVFCTINGNNILFKHQIDQRGQFWFEQSDCKVNREVFGLLLITFWLNFFLEPVDKNQTKKLKFYTSIPSRVLPSI